MNNKKLIHYICAIVFVILEVYALHPATLWSGSLAIFWLLHIVIFVAACAAAYALFFRWKASFSYKIGVGLGIFVVSFILGIWLATWAARSYLMFHFR